MVKNPFRYSCGQCGGLGSNGSVPIGRFVEVIQMHPVFSARMNVVVIGMGGTISAVSEGRTGFETYEPGRLPVAELVNALRPEIDEIAEVGSEEFGAKSSGEYTILDYYDLSRRVDECLRHADAVVICSGTAALTELAYFLDLTVRSSKPVVLTGAMRPWTVLGSDGPPNLYNAVRLAASGRTHRLGTTVLLNDQILPARDATKTDALRLHAFSTSEYGALGTVDEKEIRLQRAPARPEEGVRTPFDLATIPRDGLPRIEIAGSYVDAGGEAITASVRAGAGGIVFAGVPSPRQLAAARATEHGVTFVAANGYGAGAMRVQSKQVDVISAGDLAPNKARILLMLARAVTSDQVRIRDWFATIGNAQF
ncbi:asparaginase [Streptomyces mooreae]|uniref:asparaginase n=1 Tax=Streptomyces mooreae TaxID=3075523 RepID=UPI00374E1D79